MKAYNGYVPPCGIYCGGCSRYQNGKKNSCDGAEVHCKTNGCKSIYQCSLERGLEFCHECGSYPCSRFRKFAETWLKYGQNLHENQELISKKGVDHFLNSFKEKDQK